jgi:hypothetical protein
MYNQSGTAIEGLLPVVLRQISDLTIRHLTEAYSPFASCTAQTDAPPDYPL